MDTAHARAAGALALAAGLLLTASASADIVLFEDDFESGQLKSAWSSNSVINSNPYFSRFNGRHSLEKVQFTIPFDKSIAITPGGKNSQNSGGNDSGGGAGGGDDTGGGGSGGGGDSGGGGGGNPPPPQFILKFDLYIIDSWDGAGTHGPDFFQVKINNQVVMLETFDNHGGSQTFRQPDLGPIHMGYHQNYKDSIYRNIEIPFEILPDDTSIKVAFQGLNLQGVVDESFGIDNVSIRMIPAPGSAAVAFMGLAMASRRRRSGTLGH